MTGGVLVVGSGGREHALAWKLACSPQVKRLVVAPGNAGFPAEWERWPLDFSGSHGKRLAEYKKLAERAKKEGITLAVIGPDNPLADGIVDVFEAAGVLVFGPSRAAARIEASKIFAKEVMQAAGVPTARYFRAEGADEAKEILARLEWSDEAESGWVVKADGLALGKGVWVCHRPAEAKEALAQALRISDRLIIEEFLPGKELSWMAFCDGSDCALLPPARDHKRLKNSDQGPNTGGMGAYSPVPGATDELGERLRREVFLPVLQEMSRRGCPFSGILFAGLMIDEESGKYWVLEFNARFGDPETQVVVPRISSDLFELCLAVAEKRLCQKVVPTFCDCAVVVVGAAPGYPEQVKKGALLPIGPGTVSSEVPPYFYAGVSPGEKGGLAVSGGRVLGAMGIGPDFQIARAQAYARLEQARFPEMQFRSDIAAGVARAVPIVVFASGRGSNFDAIVDSIRDGTLNARVVALLCDRDEAPVMKKARNAGIPTFLVKNDDEIFEVISRFSPHFLVLAGYMRIVTPRLIEAFRSERGYSRIVNIHPSLLPAFPGVRSYEQVFFHGAHVAGVTVHLVEAEVDTGPICAQEAFSIRQCRSVEEVERLGLEVEHRLYPETLRWVLNEDFSVERRSANAEQAFSAPLRRLCVCPH